ncbi:MAG: hypothetical protein AAF202_11930, partial [Pseudomonadota bacterium]
QAKPLTRQYISQLLQFYLFTENLFEEASERTPTMAEKLLNAFNTAEPRQRAEGLKKVGDTALYVTGFFGDSFKRKIIDIDYYVEIGGSAYASLATADRSNMYTPVFEDLSSRFPEYVDVLTYMSQQSQLQSNNDLLRLYDRYIMTGSKLAEEQLEAEGILNSDLRQGRLKKQ